MTDHTPSKKPRGPATKLTKKKKRDVLLHLKNAALAGDISAAAALLNHELAEVTRQRLYMDMDRVAA